jgi:CheY-like chemotaxis protein
VLVAQDPARVLIVEDNPDNMTLMDYLLRAGRYAPALAPDGPTGVSLAGELEPALVLLDIHMPGMDGFEVASAIRARRTLCAPVLVAVTALAMIGDEDRILAAGFDGYLTKPIDPTTFVADVEQFLAPEQRVGQAR